MAFHWINIMSFHCFFFFFKSVPFPSTYRCYNFASIWGILTQSSKWHGNIKWLPFILENMYGWWDSGWFLIYLFILFIFTLLCIAQASYNKLVSPFLHLASRRVHGLKFLSQLWDWETIPQWWFWKLSVQLCPE